jgi:hypothetical protein
MLNLFQHLVGYSLPLADASFIPAHRTGFSDALLINCFSIGHSKLVRVKEDVPAQ